MWNVWYNLADSKGSIHEVIDEAGVRKCFGEKDRNIFSIVNQLIAGQPRLKHHLARLQIVEDSRCEHCGEEETSEHFLFACTHYVIYGCLVQVSLYVSRDPMLPGRPGPCLLSTLRHHPSRRDSPHPPNWLQQAGSVSAVNNNRYSHELYYTN